MKFVFPKSSVLFLMICTLSGCGHLDDDLSFRPIDGGIKTCYQNNVITRGDPSSDANLKKCILKDIDTQKSDGELLQITLRRMGFECEQKSGWCVARFHRRLHPIGGLFSRDEERYTDLELSLFMIVDDHSIKSFVAEDTHTNEQGEIYYCVKTNNLVPADNN